MPRFPNNLVYIAVLALSMSSVAGAQTTAPATPPAKPAATGPGPGSTGMDKGAGSGTASKRPNASVASSDIRFMEKAIQGNMAEVELGKLAQGKAESAEVKAFGKKLVDDHSKANDKLKALASSKGVTVPTAMTASQKRDQDRLAKLSGNAFDRAFMKHMVDDHKGDVRDYKSTAKSAKDAELRSFASSTVPTLEEHLALAKQTEAAVKRAPKDAKTAASKSATAGATGIGKSTATPGKNTAATTGTAGPGTGMPASTEQAGTSSPQPPGGPADTKKAAPQK